MRGIETGDEMVKELELGELDDWYSDELKKSNTEFLNWLMKK